MSTTTKRELIDLVARATAQPRAVVRTTVQCFLDQIIDEMSKGNRLEFRDFGVFEVRERGSRVVRNPRTQKLVEVDPDRTIRFKAGRAMKQAVEAPPELELVSGNGKMAQARP